MQILEALAQLTHPPLAPFENLLRLEARRLPYGASVFAITPIVNAAIASTLLDYRAKGHPVALIVIGRQPDRSLIPIDLPLFVILENWTEMKALKMVSE